MGTATQSSPEPERLARVTAGDLMRTELAVLGPDTSLAAAAQLFSTRHISGAPVVDAAGHPLGVVSLADLVRAKRTGEKPSGKPLYYLFEHGQRDFVGMFTELDGPPGQVADVMTDFVLSVSPQTPLLQAVRLMVADGVHRVLVVDGGKLVGILTSMDVMRALVSSPSPPPS